MNDRSIGDISLEINEFQAASPADQINAHGGYNRQFTRRDALKLALGTGLAAACNAVVSHLPVTETPTLQPTEPSTDVPEPTIAPTATIDKEQQKTQQAAIRAYERSGSDTSWSNLSIDEQQTAISLMARTREVKLIDPVRAIGRVFEQTKPDGTKLDDPKAPRVPAYAVDDNELDPENATILEGAIVIDGGAIYVNQAGNQIRQLERDGDGLFLTEVSPDGSVVRQATTPGFETNRLRWDAQIGHFIPSDLPNSGGTSDVSSEKLVEVTGSQLNIVNYRLDIEGEAGRQSLAITNPADSGISGKPFIKDDGNVYVADSTTSYKWNLDRQSWEKVIETPTVSENLEAKIDAWESGETPFPDPDTLMTVYGRKIGLGFISMGPLDTTQSAYDIQAILLGYKLVPNQDGDIETVLAFGLQAGSHTTPVAEDSQKPFRYAILCHTGTADTAKPAQVVNKKSISLDQLGMATGDEAIRDLPQEEYLKLLGESIGKPLFVEFGVKPVVVGEAQRKDPALARLNKAADAIAGSIDRSLALRTTAHRLSAGGLNPSDTSDVDQFSRISDTVSATDLFCIQLAIPHPNQ